MIFSELIELLDYKFFMQLGRFDELGSGILNINKYCKAYSGHDHPEFIEGAVFRTIIPIDENLGNEVDAVNDAEVDAVPEKTTVFDAVNDAEVDAVPKKITVVDAVNNRIKSKRDATKKRLKVLNKLNYIILILSASLRPDSDL